MIKDNFVLEINTKNIINNYNFFKNLNKNLIVAPTIKANAYGMGSKKIFSLLKKNKWRRNTIEHDLVYNPNISIDTFMCPY